MSALRARAAALALAAGLPVAACAYDGGYSRTGVALSYGAPYYDSWYDPYYGPYWYRGYYPVQRIVVVDRRYRRHRAGFARPRAAAPAAPPGMRRAVPMRARFAPARRIGRDTIVQGARGRPARRAPLAIRRN